MAYNHNTTGQRRSRFRNRAGGSVHFGKQFRDASSFAAATASSKIPKYREDPPPCPSDRTQFEVNPYRPVVRPKTLRKTSIVNRVPWWRKVSEWKGLDLLIDHVKKRCEGQVVASIEKNPGRGLTHLTITFNNGEWLTIEPNVTQSADGQINLNGIIMLTSAMLRGYDDNGAYPYGPN